MVSDANTEQSAANSEAELGEALEPYREALEALYTDPLPDLPEDFAENLVRLAHCSTKRVAEVTVPQQPRYRDVQRLMDAAAGVASEDTLRAIAEEVLQERGGFTSAAIHVVFPIRGTIELMSIAGKRRELEGRLCYPLKRSEHRRDIQADIVERMVAERLSPGLDPRYFRYLHDSTEQGDDWKLFVPLIVVRDKTGRHRPELLRWRKVSERRSCGGDASSTVFEPEPIAEHFVKEVIGTLVMSRDAVISESDVVAILESVSSDCAKRVFETTVRSLAEKCLGFMVSACAAAGGTIYLFPDGLNPDELRNVEAGPDESLQDVMGIPRHQWCCFRMTADEGVTELEPPQDKPPRMRGAGRQALQWRTPVFLGEEQLRERNPRMLEYGITNLLVYPLIWGGSAFGLMYLHAVREGDEALIQSSHQAAQLCSSVIGSATDRLWSTRSRQRAAALLALEQAVLSHERLARALEVIANEVYAFTGSDIVTAFHFPDTCTAGRFVTKPEWRQVREVVGQLKGVHVDTDAHSSLVTSKLRDREFVISEDIKTTIVIPLVFEGVLLGALIVDYRDQQRLSPWKRQELTLLGNICAVALRLFELRRDPKADRATVERTHASLRCIVNDSIVVTPSREVVS